MLIMDVELRRRRRDGKARPRKLRLVKERIAAAGNAEGLPPEHFFYIGVTFPKSLINANPIVQT